MGCLKWGNIVLSINSRMNSCITLYPRCVRANIKMNMQILIDQVSRRSWTGNSNAEATVKLAMKDIHNLEVTIPYHVRDHSIIESALEKW